MSHPAQAQAQARVDLLEEILALTPTPGDPPPTTPELELLLQRRQRLLEALGPPVEGDERTVAALRERGRRLVAEVLQRDAHLAARLAVLRDHVRAALQRATHQRGRTSTIERTA